MPAIRLNPAITFFATPAEVAGWVSRWKKQHNLHFVFGRVFPTSGLTQDIDWEDSSAVRNAVEQHEFLFFRTEPMDVSVASANQIPGRNPNHLHVNLPMLTPNGLRWGSLGSVGKQSEAAEVWNQIARDLLARTAGGAWFKLPGRGKLAYEEDVRYSQGAALLWRNGTALLGGGRTVVARLDTPQDDVALET